MENPGRSSTQPPRRLQFQRGPRARCIWSRSIESPCSHHLFRCQNLSMKKIDSGVLAQKWLRRIEAVAILFALMATTVPSFASSSYSWATYYAPKRSGAITIDGDLSDWEG